MSPPPGAPTLPRPLPAITQTPNPGPAFNSWPTYGYDNAHTGFNPNTSAFVPRSVTRLHLVWETQLHDYNTQTQPVLATGLAGHLGILIAGGASGNAYGYDATSGAQLWKTQLGSASASCDGGSGSFKFGIGGSAVYDPATAAFYIVSSQNSGPNASGHVYLYELGAIDGRIASSVDVAPSTLPGEFNVGHTSVVLDEGKFYVGTGSLCDISPWRGRIAVVDHDSMRLDNTFFTAYNAAPDLAPYSGGGVWAWGGVGIDGAHNVYAGVGNADKSTDVRAPFLRAPSETSAYGDHFVSLAKGATKLLGSYLPALTLHGSSVDLDLSGTAMVASTLSCPETAAIEGKSGQLYLFHAGDLSSGPFQSLEFGPSFYGSNNFANPGFSPMTGLLYAPVPTGGEPVVRGPGIVALSPCTGSPIWATAFGADSSVAHAPRSMPSVTAGGIVLEGAPCRRDATGGCNGTGKYGGAVWVVDAVNGALLNDGRPILTTPAQIRMAPVVDGTWVFVLDNSGDLYGLTLDANYPKIVNTYTFTRDDSPQIHHRD